jgi:hypothetical protein
MPAAQFFERGPSKGALQSQLLGEGIGQAGGQIAGQQVRRGQLAQAFKEARTAQQEGGGYLDMMEKIAPYMMTVPGGPELLSNIAPILAQGSENDAISNELKKLNDQTNSIEEQKVNGGPKEGIEPKPKMVKVPGSTMQIPEEKGKLPEARFKEKTIPKSPENLFPQRTVEPQYQRPMNPQEKNKFALEVMETSKKLKNPISYQDALNLAEQQNQSIEKFNDKIEKEKEATRLAMKEMGREMVTRAQNSGMISTPEDNTVIEKFAYESRNAANPAEQWEYIRTQKQRFDNARASIRTAGDLSGPLGNFYKKSISGEYKDISEIQKSIKEPMNFYKEHGLIPELRDEVTTSLGLGPEMTEETIFPFEPNQKKQIESFPKSPKELSLFQKIRSKVGEIGKLEHEFPGNEYRLPDDERLKFKEELANILSDPDNKDINLISLRGRLNQEKKYAWQDISQSLNELMAEGRFTPDYIQEQQLPIINQAPLPGMLKQFEYLYKGKK